MSGRIDGLKTVKEVDRKIAALDKKTTAHVAAMDRAAVKHQQAVNEWKQQVLTGFDEGKILETPQPVQPEMLRLAADHLARLRHEREALNRERLEAISASGSDVLRDASKAIEEIVQRAAPHIAELDKSLTVLREAQSDMQAVADATNAISTVGVVKSPDSPALDLMALAIAVRTGTDPLAGHREHTERVLGMKVEKVGADGKSSMESVLPREDPEATRVRQAAFAAQHNAMSGRNREKPLGYRSGML